MFSEKIVMRLFYMLSLLLFLNCSASNSKNSVRLKVDGLVVRINHGKFHRLSDSLGMKVKFKKKSFSSSVFLNDQLVFRLQNPGMFRVPLGSGHYGVNTLSVKSDSISDKASQNLSIHIFPEDPPKFQLYSVMNEYEHPPPNFTQGLYLSGDTIFESSGQYGSSALKKYNYRTGETYQQYDLPNEYFGEGVTILDNKVYQLTYKENIVLVYDRSTFDLLYKKEFPSQGWGITHNNQNFFVSDGSHRLYIVEPLNFEISDTLEVMDNNGFIKNINELEYIEDYIYANVWFEDEILVINPRTGIVTKKLDLKDLRSSKPGLINQNVLNGIAYDPEQQCLIITGKKWPKLYELKLHD